MKNQAIPYVDLLKKEMELRNYSSRTISTYCHLLSTLQQATNVPLEDIDVEAFKEYLHKRITHDGISVSLINQSISAFKILQEDVLKRPWEPFRLKRPRREQKVPVVLSVGEIERMIHATTNIKHRAIVMLAYSSGLRKAEVLQIKPGAIDSQRMQLRVVQGKGKKDRYSLLSVKALEFLRFYYRLHRPSRYLFEAQGRKGQPLSARTLDHIIKASGTKAGIKKNVSFHTLRHSFATHLLEQGVNLRVIQSFLGHVSLKTTAIYLHVARVDPSRIASPIDSMDL